MQPLLTTQDTSQIIKLEPFWWKCWAKLEQVTPSTLREADYGRNSLSYIMTQLWKQKSSLWNRRKYAPSKQWIENEFDL